MAFWPLSDRTLRNRAAPAVAGQDRRIYIVDVWLAGHAWACVGHVLPCAALAGGVRPLTGSSTAGEAATFAAIAVIGPEGAARNGALASANLIFRSALHKNVKQNARAFFAL
jgi:hypothetical protein